MQPRLKLVDAAPNLLTRCGKFIICLLKQPFYLIQRFYDCERMRTIGVYELLAGGLHGGREVSLDAAVQGPHMAFGAFQCGVKRGALQLHEHVAFEKISQRCNHD
jgi:hypothetical protein